MELTRFQVGVIIPTHSYFDYAERAIRSCFEHTPNALVLLVDDASPEACRGLSRGVIPEQLEPVFKDSNFKDRLVWIGYQERGGLTRSWNGGLQLLNNIRAEQRPTYVVCTNSDVLFTPGWTDDLVYSIEECGYDLVGPLTNAPGPNAVQDVRQLLPDYRPSDDPAALAHTAQRLRELGREGATSHVNGFCMLAKLETWWKHAYDAEHVFRPVNAVNSRGQKNPTPLMTGNDDEFQGRLDAAGGTICVSYTSFVFHYRSVSRGERHKQGLWYRLDGSHA